LTSRYLQASVEIALHRRRQNCTIDIMSGVPRVVILIESSRAAGQGLLRGIAKYAHLYGPWTFYRMPPAYRGAGFYSDTRFRNRAISKKEKKTSLRKSGVDGIIAHIPNKEVAEELIPRGCPAVVIPANEIIPGLPNLAGDKDRAGELAAEHLLSIGLRHFAFCGYDPNYWSRERYHGFQKRIGQAGYNVHTFHQAKPQSRRIWENEQGPIANWLQSLPKTVGVWVWNDDLAEYVIEACKISGLVVPDDVCVLGADNDDLVCSMCEPPLSSVAFNFEKAGYEIAELLHKLMKGRKVKKRIVTLHTTHIVTRQSTNTLALQDRDVAEAVRYIYANAHKPIQVQDVLSAVTVSRRVLYERFQEVLGRPVYEEIMRVRAERIVRLLVDTNLPISKIAQDLELIRITGSL